MQCFESPTLIYNQDYMKFNIPDLDVDFFQSKRSQMISSDTQNLYQIIYHYVVNHKVKRVLDLGTGNGILLLMLVKDFTDIECVGVEIVESLVKLANSNFEKLSEYIGKEIDYSIILANYASYDYLDGEYDLIISNPPYNLKNCGRLSPIYEKSIARFELKATQFELLNTIKQKLSKMGTSYIIYPKARMKELIMNCEKLLLNCSIFNEISDESLNNINKVSNNSKFIFKISHAKN
jgi:tRNA1(Val) A37 N6-methylase TrmN6